MSFISKFQGRRNRKVLGAFGPWSGPHQILVISEIEKENKHSSLRKKFDCLELFLGLTIKSISLRTSCELQGNSNFAFLCSLSDVWESQGINISGFSYVRWTPFNQKHFLFWHLVLKSQYSYSLVFGFRMWSVHTMGLKYFWVVLFTSEKPTLPIFMRWLLYLQSYREWTKSLKSLEILRLLKLFKGDFIEVLIPLWDICT